MGDIPDDTPEDPEDPLDVVVTDICDPDDGSDIVSEYAESVSWDGSDTSSRSEGG